MTDTTDFLKGQEDCFNGIPHESGKPESYDRGYSYQYQIEQNQEYLTRNKGEK